VPETISILPVGIFNGILKRNNLPIEAIMVDDGDSPRMQLAFEGTAEQALAKTVDELALLDVALHLRVRAISARLSQASDELREMFKLFDEGVDDDDLDDAIAEVQRLSGLLSEVIKDYDNGFNA
jgi:hypothetical protein